MRLNLTNSPEFSGGSRDLTSDERARFLQVATRYEAVINEVVADTDENLEEATRRLLPLFDDAQQQGTLSKQLTELLANAMRLAKPALVPDAQELIARFEELGRGDYAQLRAGFDRDIKTAAMGAAGVQTLRTDSLQWATAAEATPPATVLPEAITPGWAAHPSGAPPEILTDGRPVIQGFRWDSAGHLEHPWWTVLAENAERLAKAGFAALWMPPASAGANVHGYLPHRWFDFNSGYGTAAEHQSAVSALVAAGVVPIADVVVNHRVGVTSWADFEDPYLPPEAVAQDDEWPGARGAPDSGAGFDAGRDLDHTNPLVQQAVSQLIERLVEIGYGGVRWDFARGFSPEAVRGYLAKAGLPSVGELWDNLDLNDPNAHRERIVNWIKGTDGKSAAFDFTTKGLLQDAVATGQYWRLRGEDGTPAGVIGWWPQKAWTFLDNHDTGTMPSGQGHWPFPPDKLDQGYAYLLTHPGTPVVFWPHFFDWGEPLKKVIMTASALRAEMGVGVDSNVDIEGAQPGLYAAITHGKNGSLAMKLGPVAWSPPGPGWTLGISGNDFTIWKKAGP